MRLLHPSPPGRRTALTDEAHDVLAPSGEGAADGSTAPGLVAAARSLARGLLGPAAEATDRAGIVPPEHLQALARAGLCGLFCRPAAPLAATREIFEILAGACGVTFFVWAQHQGPVRMLASSDNQALRARYLADLARMVAARSWSYDLTLRAAAALVAAGGGRTMERSHPAQRLLREAAFYTIQAQTPALRAATLSRVQPRS